MRDDLTPLKDEVLNTQAEWNIKYLHLKSIDNFIFHFDNVADETDKKWIYETIRNYLLHCKGINEAIDRKKSNGLYYEYVDKIANYYRYNLKFRMIGDATTYGIIFIVTYVSLGFIFNFYISLFTIVPFLHFWISINNKRKQKKVYGIFY